MPFITAKSLDTSLPFKLKTQIDASAEKLVNVLVDLKNVRQEANINSTNVDSVEVAQLKVQLRNQSLELLKISAERDLANRALVSKDKEINNLKKQLKAAEFRNEKKNFKNKVDELQIKLKDKDMEIKKKDEIIEKMRLSRKKAEKERKKVIKNMKEEMEIKINEMEKTFEVKMLKTSEVVSIPDSGYQTESSDVSESRSIEASFESEPSCTKCEINFYENEFNINWIEKYLTMNSQLMALIVYSNISILETSKFEKKLFEDKIQWMEEKQKQLEVKVMEQEMDEENEELRKRDIDFLLSLL